MHSPAPLRGLAEPRDPLWKVPWQRRRRRNGAVLRLKACRSSHNALLPRNRAALGPPPLGVRPRGHARAAFPSPRALGAHRTRRLPGWASGGRGPGARALGVAGPLPLGWVGRALTRTRSAPAGGTLAASAPRFVQEAHPSGGSCPWRAERCRHFALQNSSLLGCRPALCAKFSSAPTPAHDTC